MLTSLCAYAADKGLPYVFVEWALDRYGYDIEAGTDFSAISAEWWDETQEQA